MKDSEFIELLNLYLDHEISAADAARLEAEVQSNANRRRVYQDYCRMQKACKMLAQDFAGDTPGEPDRKVVAFPGGSSAKGSHRSFGYVAAGVFAAAACVAIVFVGHPRATAPSAAPAATYAVQSTPAPAPVQAVAAVAETSVAPTVQPVNEFSLRNGDRASGLIISKPADSHLAWIENVRLTPVQLQTQLDPLHLETNPALRSEERTYTSGNKSLSSDLPVTAIRFQR